MGDPHDGPWSRELSTELVERAQGGDRDAFDLLATRSYDRLYSVAQRILRDSHSAEDAVQEALIRAWRDLRSLRDPDRFEAWTYRLLVRACADHSRGRRRIGVEVTDLSIDHPSSQDEFAAVVQRDEVERAFLRLTVDHRAVLVLTHYVGLPAPDVAQYLSIPVGTVYSRLHYATQLMRRALETPAPPKSMNQMRGQVL